MKKLIFVTAIFAMVSCSKKHEQVQPRELKNQEVVYDTLYIIDSELGEAVMVVEERVIFK